MRITALTTMHNKQLGITTITVQYLGKLCVSAVRMGCSTRLRPTITEALLESRGTSTGTSQPLIALELSWKAITELLGWSLGRVDLTIWNNVSGWAMPFRWILPLKNQCLECSEFD